MIARLNEERINAGKGPIGFLNPSLYANPSMLNDITTGTYIYNHFEALPTVAPPTHDQFGWQPLTARDIRE